MKSSSKSRYGAADLAAVERDRIFAGNPMPGGPLNNEDDDGQDNTSSVEPEI